MTEMEEIMIIKLGGSVITEKNKPFSLKSEILDDLIDQIVKAKQKCIVIHGAGSFAHPLAQKYDIVSGKNPKIKNQIYGLAETHSGVAKLNTIITNKFLEKGIATIPLQPSTLFHQDLQNLDNLHKIINDLLDLNITPLLYGDIILGSDTKFSIISGDRIILEICKQFVLSEKEHHYQISKVIFCFDQDGLFVKDEKEKKKILLECKQEELDHLQFYTLQTKIDVTGGIKGKLQETKEICKLKIPVQLVNGQKKNYLLKALQQQQVISTTIN